MSSNIEFRPLTISTAIYTGICPTGPCRITVTRTSTFCTDKTMSMDWTTSAFMCYSCGVAPTLVAVTVPVPMPGMCTARPPRTVTLDITTTVTSCPTPLTCPANLPMTNPFPTVPSMASPTTMSYAATTTPACPGSAPGSPYNGLMGSRWGIYCDTELADSTVDSQNQDSFIACIAACDMHNVVHFGNTSMLCAGVSYFRNRQTPNCQLKRGAQFSELRIGIDSAKLLSSPLEVNETLPTSVESFSYNSMATATFTTVVYVPSTTITTTASGTTGSVCIESQGVTIIPSFPPGSIVSMPSQGIRTCSPPGTLLWPGQTVTGRPTSTGLDISPQTVTLPGGSAYLPSQFLTVTQILTTTINIPQAMLTTTSLGVIGSVCIEGQVLTIIPQNPSVVSLPAQRVITCSPSGDMTLPSQMATGSPGSSVIVISSQSITLPGGAMATLPQQTIVITATQYITVTGK